MNCEFGEDQGSVSVFWVRGASVTDVNAAGIELLNCVTVAISSPNFFNVQYACEDTILLFLFSFFFPLLGF